MASKSILRVQVSLRRVVNFNDEQPGHDEKSPADEKATVQGSKTAKALKQV
jgi:hypothetical protein